MPPPDVTLSAGPSVPQTPLAERGTGRRDLAPVVVAVTRASAAAAAGVLAGDEIIAVDGQVPRDIIEWQMMTDEADIVLDVRRGGLDLTLEVDKRAGEPLGIEISSAVFDRVRTCDNHCEFCFIYQLPKGMRRSLYLKDDDYRLSFLYGNFTTLTRFTELDLERVVTERLSPLHVSIHSTDPELRSAMLKNQRGAMSLRWLRALLDHGIAVRGQIVVCPGVNDGEALGETFAGILDRFPDLDSVAVVPLGVSQFNPEASMRPHTTAEAVAVVEAVTAWQSVFQATIGRRMVYAADEYYLMAGIDFPPAGQYDGFPMHEDGIGMARAFEREFTAASEGDDVEVIGVRRGFFAVVDEGTGLRDALPPNPAAYTGLRTGGGAGAAMTTAVSLRPSRRAPIGVLTGELGRPVIEPLVASLGRDDVRVLTVANEFFGGNTGVTGLMTGADVNRVLGGEPEGHRYLLPDVCLSDDGRFLDGVHVDELARPVDIVATDGASLRRALVGEADRGAA